MIVKLQMPVWPTTGPALVYDEARTMMVTLPVTPEMRQRMGSAVRGYFEAIFNGDTLELSDMLEDQGW